MNPYTNHYYDKQNPFASGQYDGYQYIVNRYRLMVNSEYAAGVRDGQQARVVGYTKR